VQERKTSRYLLFDEQSQLCGRRAGRDRASEIVRPSKEMLALAFSGVHVISPRMLARMDEDGAFSIITSYLRRAGDGEKILAFRADEYYWRDLGKPENVAQAAEDVKQKRLQLSSLNEDMREDRCKGSSPLRGWFVFPTRLPTACAAGRILTPLCGLAEFPLAATPWLRYHRCTLHLAKQL
jgi:hypothetical protein